MSPEAIGRTIQLILAPVVMFSACAVFVGGVLNHYTSVGDRIRALTRERLELLRDGGSTLRLERLLVVTMCIIALTATIPAEWVGPLVYGVFLLSVLAVLGGVVLVTMEIGSSCRSLAFEVERVTQLPAPVTEIGSAETV